MAFNLSGSTITQTGTDTDLSGLAGITGVSTSTKGVKTLYLLDFSSASLELSGTLEYDPDFEELHFRTDTKDDFFKVLNGGILRIGKETTVNGKTRFSTGDALVMPKDTTLQFFINSLNILQGGLFEWRGGVIYSADSMGVIGSDSALAFKCYSGKFVTISNQSGTAGAAMVCRNDGQPSKVEIDNIELDSLYPSNSAPIIYSTLGLSNVSFNVKTGFIQTRGGSTSLSVISGIEFANNAFVDGDFQFNGINTSTQSQPYEITNIDVGTGLRTYQEGNRIGHIALFQELGGNITDVDGNVIEGAKRYIETTDSGNRTNPGTNPLYRGNRDFTGSDFDTYTHITDVNGDFPLATILTGRLFYNAVVVGSPIADLYSNSQVLGVDDFTLNYISYGYNIAQTNIALKSSSQIFDNKPLIADTSITESVKTTVDAYTELETPQKLYDRAFAYLFDNYAGETETLVSISGNEIDLGSRNLTIDATAASAFAIDGSGNITIHADTFTGDIKTTGTFSLINGAVHVGLINDELLVNDGDVIITDGVHIVAQGGGTVNITLLNSTPSEIEVRNNTTLNVVGDGTGKTTGTTITETSGTINLDSKLVGSANWTFDGVETITQTGTSDETDTINGIAAIPGVSVSVSATTVSLDIPYKVVVNGTVTTGSTFDPTFSRDGEFANELRINGSWTAVDGDLILPTWKFTQAQITGFNNQNRNSIYLFGGTLDITNLTILANGGQYWNGGTLKVRNCTFNAQGLLPTNDTQFTTQAGNPDLDIIGLTIIGGRFFVSNANFVNFSGYTPRFMQRGFGNGFLLTKTVDDFNPSNNDVDASTFAGGLTTYRNCVIGSDFTVDGWSPDSNNRNTILATSQIVIESRDENGAAVENFKLYYSDNPTGATAGANPRTGVDYSLPIIYDLTSDASGDLSTEITIGVSQDDLPIIKRSETQTDDLYTFNLISYRNQVSSTPSLDLKGAGIKTFSQVMVVDSLITEANKTTVDAYTTIDTSQQFYDRAKSYLYDNYAGETNTLVIRSGNEINLGSRNLTIDATAANVFSVDGSGNITIKANTFTGNITTTGVVALANGAVLNGGIVDANGDSFITFDSIDSWTIYPTATDRDNNTNITETGTGIYRFNFSSPTTFYARVVKDSVVFLVEFPVNNSGETIYSLSSEALLTTLPTASEIWTHDISGVSTDGQAGKELLDAAQTDQSIKPDLTIINNNVKKASKLIPANEDLT